MGQDSQPVSGSQSRQGPWCDGSYERRCTTFFRGSWYFPTADGRASSPLLLLAKRLPCQWGSICRKGVVHGRMFEAEDLLTFRHGWRQWLFT